ncbi:hypothetical protein AD935_01645 [Gluconobacter japonicus]|nr:hypothetical protein AD935_01645 [Gluconobacter japonicus]
MWTVFTGGITSTQAVPINKDAAAQHAAIIKAGLRGLFRVKGRRRSLCSSVSQYRSLISSLLIEPGSVLVSPIKVV